jgi:hypothetical protein
MDRVIRWACFYLVVIMALMWVQSMYVLSQINWQAVIR